MYSGVAFGSPLLTSPEYKSNPSIRPHRVQEGGPKISRKRVGKSWSATVSEQLRRRRAFEQLVADALDSLPAEFRDRLENVEVVIEDWPEDDALLGLYHGIPQTSRGSGYAGVLPDVITIYRMPLELRVRRADDLAEVVRRTVLHEIAHHFGIDDDRLEELGWA